MEVLAFEHAKSQQMTLPRTITFKFETLNFVHNSTRLSRRGDGLSCPSSCTLPHRPQANILCPHGDTHEILEFLERCIFCRRCNRPRFNTPGLTNRGFQIVQVCSLTIKCPNTCQVQAFQKKLNHFCPSFFSLMSAVQASDKSLDPSIFQ